MITQLLLSKRLFVEASEYAKRQDAFSCGIAVSLLQDAVEILVWALIKHRGISVNALSPFTKNLELLKNDGVSFPETPKLLDLNTARVGFKHYGNLPASTEAQKFQGYVEDFLRNVITSQFRQDFDSLSLVDLVPFPEIKARLKAAETHFAKAEFEDAASEASIAKVELFGKLDKYIPRVTRDLGIDPFARSDALRDVRVFRYLEEYLNMLREVSLVALLRLSLEDYAFLTTTLSQVSKTEAGTWRMVNLKFHDEAVFKRQIACLVDISIRLHSVV